MAGCLMLFVHVATSGGSTAVLSVFSSSKISICHVFFPGASQSHKKNYMHLLYMCSVLQNLIVTEATRIVEWCVQCSEEEELGMYILEWTSSLFKVEHLHWLINSAGHVILLQRYLFFLQSPITSSFILSVISCTDML